MGTSGTFKEKEKKESNICVIIERTSQSLNNIPLVVQNRIHDINVYDSDYIMSSSSPIPSVSDTLKKIYLGGPLWGEFISKYYNDKN